MPAAVAALPLLAGSAAGAILVDVTPQHFVLAAAASAALALIAGCAFRADHLAWAVVTCVVLGSALAGYSMSTSFARELYAPSIAAWFDAGRASRGTGAADDLDPVSIEGVLRDDAAVADFGALLTVDVRNIISGATIHHVRGGVRVTVGGSVRASDTSRWRAGRAVRMSVLLRRPAAFRNPGVPDEARVLARRGIALLGTVKSAALVDVVRHGSCLDEWSSGTRAWVRRVIGTHVGRLDATSAAVSLSILIGDRTGLPGAWERRLQDAGTYHVVAISGGNIAILTAILVFTTRALRIPYRAAALTVIVILSFYGKVAGGSPSVSRAVAAAIVFFIAAFVDHRGAPLNVVAIAAIFGVAAIPVSVLDPAFLLSFGATAGIVLGVPRVTSGLSRKPREQDTHSDVVASGFSRKILSALAVMFAATVCAELAIAPIAASFFSRLTAAGLVVNFAAIPLMALVQSASLLLLAVSTFSLPATGAAAFVVHLSAAGLLQSSRFVDLAPWLARDVPAPAWWLCCLYYLAGVCVLARTTRMRVALLAAIACCLIVGPPASAPSRLPPPPHGHLRIVFLDVGQGDATIIMPPGGDAVMVDAGGLAGTTFDIGARVLVPAHAVAWRRAVACVRADSRGSRSHRWRGGAASALSASQRLGRRAGAATSGQAPPHGAGRSAADRVANRQAG